MQRLHDSILLVEDNEDDIFFVKRALKAAGVLIPLQVVQDGQQAIEYLGGSGCYANREQYPMPRLVLLDLKLPFKTGLEVLQWIREQPHLAPLVVIVLTTSKEARDIQGAYLSGANSYLVKPTMVEGLQEIIKAIKLYWFEYNQWPQQLE